MIGALPQTPEFIAFVFPKMGRKNRRQKSAAHFGVKSVQPLRSHSCVAVSCRTEKANYIINNCLEDYSIYTVCATLPYSIKLCALVRGRQITDKPTIFRWVFVIHIKFLIFIDKKCKSLLQRIFAIFFMFCTAAVSKHCSETLSFPRIRQ